MARRSIRKIAKRIKKLFHRRNVNVLDQRMHFMYTQASRLFRNRNLDEGGNLETRA